MTVGNVVVRSAGVLSTVNHDRDAVAMRYVYPVVSRRAGGVSVGINLNVNNACNWACIYCQVPDLKRGGPPTVDMGLLEAELSQLLDDILQGDFLIRYVPESMRRLADIAFSGNGEPTSSDQFPEAVELVIRALDARGLLGTVPVRIITNGSLMQRPAVLQALSRLGTAAGEVWFKLDRATAAGMQAVNQTASSIEQVRRGLLGATSVLPVWLQTCWFGFDGEVPSALETDAYVAFVAEYRDRIRGVHLYGIARPSLQPGSERLTRLPIQALETLSARLKEIGVTATVSE